MIKSMLKDSDGDAIVEATILFPIMIMIFAALVLLSIYLPTKATLQHATQYAATAIATEISDTWLFFDERHLAYYWETEKSRLPNVYAALFSDHADAYSRGEDTVIDVEARGLSSKTGDLSVRCFVVNKIVYKEVVVTASREFTMPVNLSFIGFPETLSVQAASIAVVQNGDEFVRSMDLAESFTKYISEKFGLTDIGNTISSNWQKVESFLGW